MIRYLSRSGAEDEATVRRPRPGPALVDVLVINQ
jgi:hypothetical protein